MIIFSMLSLDFLTLNDLTIVAKHVSINALLTIGQSFVILRAEIDLSVGSVVRLTAMVAGYLISQGLPLPTFGVVVYLKPWIVILMSLLLGIVLGLVNGLVIARLSVAPFIATLGMLYAVRGLAWLTPTGVTLPRPEGDPSLSNTGFPFLGTGNILGMPMPIWLMILFGVVASFVASRRPFGRQVYAIGGNERAGGPAGDGRSCELNAIAAVVLGGTSLFGGRGMILGSIIGAFVSAPQRWPGADRHLRVLADGHHGGRDCAGGHHRPAPTVMAETRHYLLRCFED